MSLSPFPGGTMGHTQWHQPHHPKTPNIHPASTRQSPKGAPYIHAPTPAPTQQQPGNHPTSTRQTPVNQPTIIHHTSQQHTGQSPRKHSTNTRQAPDPHTPGKQHSKHPAITHTHPATTTSAHHGHPAGAQGATPNSGREMMKKQIKCDCIMCSFSSQRAPMSKYLL